jgi:hypothetical protein
MYDLGLSHARELGIQHLEKRRMMSRSDSPGFWVHARRSQEFPRCTYMPWKFPTNVLTRSSQL